MIGHPNVGSRRWVWRQYDHIVRGGTMVRPGGDAAVVRVPCEKDGHVQMKLLAFAADCNGRLVELDPYQGAAMAVAEACRNLACVGAEAIGLTDCLNFGSPERPEIMRQFARAVDGMAAACKALEVPIVSGNVSLYNETDGKAILPTPTIGAVGLVRDEGDVVRSTFERAGRVILVLGDLRGGPLGGSEWVAEKTGEVKGAPPSIDLAKEAKLQRLMLDLCRARPRPIESAHDISEGGLAIAIAEACVAGDDARAMIGATLTLRTSEPTIAAVFGEAPSRVIVSAAPEHVAAIKARATAFDVACTELGVTGGDRLLIQIADQRIDVALADLRDARERCLESIVGA